MKKRILSVILMLMLIITIVGCGVGEEEKTVSKVTESNDTQAIENETVDAIETEEAAPQDKADTEVTVEVEEYEEQKDIFVVKEIDTGDGTKIDLSNKEIIFGPFILTESIDIYSYFFTYAGYTKPDIKIYSVGKVDEWLSISFAQSSFLVKAEDFDRVAVLEEREEEDSSEEYLKSVIESAPQPGNSKSPTQTESESGSNNGTPAPVEATLPTEAPAEVTTTYSEAEVISIVESTLRAAGFKKPEEYMTAEEFAMFGPTDGMGWGIEDVPMNDPYTAASKMVEGFQFSGWNVYYIENQGSSNGYVHLKLYSGTHK